MIFGPLLGFLMKPVDVIVQLTPVDTPHTAAPDLDRRQLAGADQAVDLGDAHSQKCRHLVEGEEALFDLGHRTTIAVVGVGYLNLILFALVWRLLYAGVGLWP